tara:strand:- start:56420 stop:57094 length:675 start_codon:yes stop_codon:yes gene_type:complete
MCGRFTVKDNSNLRQYYKNLDVHLETRCNIAPTENIFLVHDDKTEVARWWLTPSWAKEISQKYSMFNARCESLASSAAFKKPFRAQRGIVPMSSFIEWRTRGAEKQPWSITNAEEAIAVAAIWDLWQQGDKTLLSCALVTTAAATAFKPWHNRMPVMLTHEESERWLDNHTEVAADDALFNPVLKFPLRLAPLDKAVGNARNKDPALMTSTGQIVELYPDKHKA